MPKPYGHGLCYELIMWSLATIWHFNYCHYLNYQATSWIGLNGASLRWDRSFGTIWFWPHLLPKKDAKESCEGS